VDYPLSVRETVVQFPVELYQTIKNRVIYLLSLELSLRARQMVEHGEKAHIGY